MNRVKGILAAGTLTGLVLVTVLALGFKSVKSQTQESTAVPEIIVQPVIESAPMPASDAATTTGSSQPTNTGQSYIQQLEETLTTMQGREAVYRDQIDAANQTILQLQDQINTDRTAQAAFNNSVSNYQENDDDHDDHEDHEDHDDDD